MRSLIKYSFILLIVFSVSISQAEPSKPRIVSLTPSFTDIIMDLGAADLLVGVSTFDKQRLTSLKKAESVGNFGSYSLEKIISLQPDIILIWPAAITVSQQQQLSSLGFKIIKRDPQTLDELITDVTYLGTLVNKEEQAKHLVQQLKQDLSALRKRYHREKPLKVFYQVWDKPIYTIGKKQIINDALELCGAKNIFDDIDLSAPQVNIESILMRDPQVIVAPEQSFLNAWQNWPALSAVKNNKLVLFQDDRIVRPSIAMVEAIKRLCVQINE